MTRTVTAECARCGKVILLADVPVPYWYHPEGQTVWCHMNDDSPPSRWGDDAVPKDGR